MGRLRHVRDHNAKEFVITDKTGMLREVLAGFNEHDLDAIMSNFSEDCVFEAPRGPDPWGRRFVGKDEVRQGLAARFEGIPDVRYLEDDHFACGTRGVSGMDDQRIRTTEGVRIDVRGCDIWTSETTGRSSAKTVTGRFGSPDPARRDFGHRLCSPPAARRLQTAALDESRGREAEIDGTCTGAPTQTQFYP